MLINFFFLHIFHLSYPFLSLCSEALCFRLLISSSLCKEVFRSAIFVKSLQKVKRQEREFLKFTFRLSRLGSISHLTISVVRTRCQIWSTREELHKDLISKMLEVVKMVLQFPFFSEPTLNMIFIWGIRELKMCGKIITWCLVVF